ncbi:MAG TPA: recombinase family protein [Verrucomicrobiota bacterium]|nr:recombinase family protein [Verrucomicrobiota bacterium]HNU51258.1 recombinase family protein [Verrucomicrobiota bacterium]
MKTAIYTRVSTDKQAHDSQLVELREFCRRRNWGSVVEFADTISGSKFTRQGLDSLLAQVRKGRVERIVVFKLDRLGRSLPHLAQLVAELANHRTALVCTTQGLDTSDSNPAGRLQLGVLMAVAEFEREIIRERVNAGLSAAKARGSKLGRPSTLDQHKPAVATLVAQGKGARVISRELGLPLSSTCRLVRSVREEQRTSAA